MSNHKTPLTAVERAGLLAHGLGRNIGVPSQLADVFRQGVAWGISQRQNESAATAPLLERIAELERELETVRKDAERLQCLFDHIEWDGNGWWLPDVCVTEGIIEQPSREEFDAAIDAAKEKP